MTSITDDSTVTLVS